jgi:5,10-methylenetetrahydromethanopterin reductase
VRVGAFLAPVRDTPDHIALAEELGFASAWCYDSPLLYQDPFAALARAADRTGRIDLGVGVLVPGLRAPVATVAALRALTALAPGRVRVAVGAGFTGRFTLGLGPVPLAALAREVEDLRGLLAGGERPHPEGGRPVRDMPVPGAGGDGAVPVYVSCRGERAQALARRLGDGAMTGVFYPGGLALVRAALGPGLPLVVHAVGAVAGEGEPLDSPRLRAAVGPVVAVAFHAFAEQPWRLAGLDPALREEAAAYVAAVTAALPPERRHQELHRGHLVELTLPQDEAVVTAANVARFSLTGTAAQLRERAAAMAADGVTELAIQPGGDVPAELRRLAAALLG